MGPFLNKTMKAAEEEQELLRFLRKNYQMEDVMNSIGDFTFGRLRSLTEEKNVLRSQGVSGHELERVLFRIATIELFESKWAKLMDAYKTAE